jgi:signal transduction histidine kinase
MLYGIQMRAHLIGLDAATLPELQEHVHAIETLTQDAIRTTRTLTVELSPPVLQNEGLAAAFRWLANHMAETYGLQVQVDAQTDYHSSSEDLQVLLFQLVRELLFNVVKHAGVKEAVVALSDDGDRIVIRVVDEGCGFDPAKLAQMGRGKSGFGLYSVRERLALFGGELSIDTQLYQGVRAIIQVPKELYLTLR